MAFTLSVRQIGERALRKIGSYSINDSAADPAQLEETLYWLDMVVAHMTSNKRIWWLVPGTFMMGLPANSGPANLATLMGNAYPVDGIVFPINCWLRDSNGDDTPLRMVRRKEFENIREKGDTGRPRVIYFDKQVETDVEQGQTANIYPQTVDGTYSLRMEAQIYSPTYAESSNGGEMAHGFGPEWQLYLVTELAAEIGDGPVKRIPQSEVDGFHKHASELLTDLMDGANRESVTQPRRTRAWGEDHHHVRHHGRGW